MEISKEGCGIDWHGILSLDFFSASFNDMFSSLTVRTGLAGAAAFN
jgi:hypothetical protein